MTWTAPSANNGFAISTYVVTRYRAGVAQPPLTFGPSATTETITGLTGGKSYTFVVAAQSPNGTGPASTPSNAITPG